MSRPAAQKRGPGRRHAANLNHAMAQDRRTRWRGLILAQIEAYHAAGHAVGPNRLELLHHLPLEVDHHGMREVLQLLQRQGLLACRGVQSERLALTPAGRAEAAQIAAVDVEPVPAVRRRHCLSCRRPMITDAATRICGSCKRTTNWRDGDDDHALGRRA